MNEQNIIDIDTFKIREKISELMILVNENCKNNSCMLDYYFNKFFLKIDKTLKNIDRDNFEKVKWGESLSRISFPFYYREFLKYYTDFNRLELEKKSVCYPYKNRSKKYCVLKNLYNATKILYDFRMNSANPLQYNKEDISDYIILKKKCKTTKSAMTTFSFKLSCEICISN